jgi:alanine-synthesizing transaminase
MFASRTNWNLTPNALSQLLLEKRTKGEPILDLTESNPSHCAFSYDSELLRALSSDRSLLYEPEPHGLLSAREGIAEYYRRHGTLVDPSNIFLTASTSEAYSHLFRLLCNPGESVLVPKPSYPLFDYLCALNDVDVRHYRLVYDDEWRIDLDSIRGGIDPSTRALLLVHPNNPTGSFVKNEEQESILKLAQRHNLALIVDEVFGEFPLAEREGCHKSFASEERCPTFTLNGISKLLGMPQMKLAWITVSGEAAVVRNAVNRLEIICDTYLSTGTPIQQVLPSWLNDARLVTDQIKRRINANYHTLHSLTAQSSVSPLNAEGGWNAILQFPRIMSDEEWALRTLKESNVLIHPGHFFEIERDACLVTSLLPEESTFSNGIGKILELVHTTLGTSA